MPPEGDGTFSKRILTCGTLGVLDDPARSGLTDVQKGAAFEVTGGHLLVRSNAHGRISGAWLRAIAPVPARSRLGDHWAMAPQRSATGASFRKRCRRPTSMRARKQLLPAANVA